MAITPSKSPKHDSRSLPSSPTCSPLLAMAKSGLVSASETKTAASMVGALDTSGRKIEPESVRVSCAPDTRLMPRT